MRPGSTTLGKEVQPTGTEALNPVLKASWRADLVFVLLSVGFSLFVFGKAFTAQCLLAPLDLGPNLYRHYRWVDPQANGIPKNHYLSDIFDYELPRHYSMYEALKQGEFPWWDPYTDFGRPLVAEAHIGGTDPVRLGLFYLLPFELAYNWSKIISCLLFGIGGYLLLRSSQYPPWICISCALAYQFASGHFIHQTPLNITSSFAYYALLWWVWARLLTRFRWHWFVAAGLLCGCIVTAGNQQSHAFLAMFAFCFVFGYGFEDRAIWRGLLISVFGSVILGCLISLPILVAQVELFLLSQRTPEWFFSRVAMLCGLLNPVALFPWLLGTFRTLDVSKFFSSNQGGLGFSVFAGTAVFVLAAGGAAHYWFGNRKYGLIRTALFLLAAYQFICLSPLINVLYLRGSNLAVLGLTVLSAYALNCLVAGPLHPRARKFIRFGCVACMAAFLVANTFAFLVLPRIETRIERYVLERDQHNESFPPVPQFRKFQVANLKREISLLNPETVVALAAVIGIYYLLRLQAPPEGRQVRLWQAVMAINLVPLLMFAQRFTVREPIVQWQRLLHGDSVQSRWASCLGLQYRLQEPLPKFGMLFPSHLPHLYRVHAATGYSSFPLPSIEQELKALGLKFSVSDSSLSPVAADNVPAKPTISPPPSGTSRFQWLSPVERRVQIVSESLNRVTIRIDAGPAGTLVRTDRYYPGWRLISPKTLHAAVLGRSLLTVDVPPSELQLTFSYTPRFLPATLPLSLISLSACLVIYTWSFVREGSQNRKNRLLHAATNIT